VVQRNNLKTNVRIIYATYYYWYFKEIISIACNITRITFSNGSTDRNWLKRSWFTFQWPKLHLLCKSVKTDSAPGITSLCISIYHSLYDCVALRDVWLQTCFVKVHWHVLRRLHEQIIVSETTPVYGRRHLTRVSPGRQQGWKGKGAVPPRGLRSVGDHAGCLDRWWLIFKPIGKCRWRWLTSHGPMMTRSAVTPGVLLATVAAAAA